MINISVSDNFKEVSDEIRLIFEKQIPYAAQQALNDSVYKATLDIRKEAPFYMEGGAMKFTKNGFQYEKAKSKRDLRAKIFIPDNRWAYMRFIVMGATEKWDSAKGGGLKPIKGNIRLNKYGNIPGKKGKSPLWRNLVVAGGGTGKGLNKKQFIGTVKGITGLWERTGGKKKKGLKLKVLIDKDPVQYKKTFPFAKITHRFFLKRFPLALNMHLAKAIKNRK